MLFKAKSFGIISLFMLPKNKTPDQIQKTKITSNQDFLIALSVGLNYLKATFFGASIIFITFLPL